MISLIDSNAYKETCFDISLDDDNDINLVSSRKEMHNVDKCIRALHETTHSKYERLTSVDAFFYDDAKVYFIEFKNQEPIDVNSNEVKNKFLATRAALARYVEERDVIYVLVTKSVYNYKDRTRKFIRTFGCLNYIDTGCEIKIMKENDFDRKFCWWIFSS